MDILDVGCGTGAITADIARAVGPDGTALAIDRDDANLAGAVQQYGGIENLRFETGDILALDDRFNKRFDIVTAARTIQWISEPQRAIRNMKKAAKLGGQVVVLDYNLDETRWEPDAPVDFLRFYGAFLEWRDVNRWDNQMLRISRPSFTQKAWSMWRATRAMSLFSAAILISLTPTHLGFGFT